MKINIFYYRKHFRGRGKGYTITTTLYYSTRKNLQKVLYYKMEMA